MIKSLYIKDFALIDELEVEFDRGLNILTGQTGAGKSIIIGALNMILGERADTEVIRRGSKKAIAEATVAFNESEILLAILKENDIEVRPFLILRREIRDTGSRAFINDTPVNISILKEVGDRLVDLHGQHDHQLLLKEENHRAVLDEFGKTDSFLRDYRQAYEEMRTLFRELRELKKREAELKEKTELYRFQVNELEQAELSTEEEEELENEMTLLDNAEILDQKAATISALADSDEANITDLLNTLKLNLEDLARIEPEFEQYLTEINTARLSINEAIHFAERYRSRIEFNPARLEKLRQRQAELNRLKKKYQRDVPELIDYLNTVKKELNTAEHFDLEIEELENRIDNQKTIVKTAAKALHDRRLEVASKLEDDIEKELSNLGIHHSELDFKVDWLVYEEGWIVIDGMNIECGPDGCDDIKMYISTNKGEAPKPLAKIASGGEISRVMLALKSTLARDQDLPVMIFDEIDTGISGEISEKVGKTMRNLSQHCQIIAITHQPQIASQADRHYKVLKKEEGDRTVTRIETLSEEDHVKEIAALMSGAQISEAAINSARELISRNTFTN